MPRACVNLQVMLPRKLNEFLYKEARRLELEDPNSYTYTISDVIRAMVEHHLVRRELADMYEQDPRLLEEEEDEPIQ